MKRVSQTLALFLLCFAATNGVKPETDQKRDLLLGDARVDFVDFQFSDLSGELRTISIPARDAAETISKGLFIDGSSIEGCNKINSSDLLLKVDDSTFVPPHKNHSEIKTASAICDMFIAEGIPFSAAPRTVLRNAVAQAEQAGYKFVVGVELEFFIFTKDAHGNLVPLDEAGYCSAQDDLNVDALTKAVVIHLAEAGIHVRKLHHEVGKGQYEMVLNHGDPLTVGDQLIRAKQILRSIGKSRNWIVSFMPKPLGHQNGSGMHIHFSLISSKTGANAFYDKTDRHGLSKTAQSFIEGVLSNAAGLSLFLNPTINSYKRLQPGYEAPVFVCWGAKNRSAMIRRPEFDDSVAARAEIRTPDPSANPYLAFAALLHAGLSGVSQRSKLRKPVETNLYQLSEQELKSRGIDYLPSSLEQAIVAAQANKLITNVMPKDLMHHLIANKTAEVTLFNQAVTNWELSRYL